VARARRSQIQTATKLALARINRGVSQQDLADAVGVSLKTIERLEANKIRDPHLRIVSNCALALKVKLEDVIEPSWREWHVFNAKRPAPPDPDEFFGGRRMALPLWLEQRMLGED
jgi:DNA-binding XRE family transcriptional regulator